MDLIACLHAPGNLPLAVECARGFSPYVEENPPDTVLFDVRGLESLYGPPEMLGREIERRIGVPASIAIASNPDVALHAAHGIRGVTVIAPGREAEVLAPLPVNLLGAAFPDRMSSETAELLHLWGIRTFGDFAKLPALGVAARIGDQGIHLQRQSRACTAEGYRQLRPMKWIRSKFEEELELDDPVELIEPLSFNPVQALNDICGRLGARSLATNEVRITAGSGKCPGAYGGAADCPRADARREGFPQKCCNSICRDGRAAPVLEGASARPNR